MEAKELLLDLKLESELLVYLYNYRIQLSVFLENSVVETHNEKADRVVMRCIDFAEKEKIQNELKHIDSQLLTLRNYLANNRE